MLTSTATQSKSTCRNISNRSASACALLPRSISPRVNDNNFLVEVTMSHEHLITRRELLTGIAGAAAASVISPGVFAQNGPRQSDLIRTENAKPGTTEWMLTNTRIDPATKFRCPWIEGYCSHTSIRAGGTLSIFVSTNPASAFTLDVYRMGYYGATGARLMRSFEAISGKPQPDPPVGDKRLRDCQW